MRKSAIIFFAVVSSAAATAWASETITYRYDARGRLVKVEHAGTVNDGVTTSYTYDKADNRTNRTTTDVVPGLIMVPLDGLTPIAIPQGS